MKEYIEREAVNALIEAECSPKVAAYLIDAVAAIPAADVRPVVRGKWKKRIKAIQADDMRRVVHAHWIFDDFDEDGKDYQCSHCKSYSRNNSDFCPNCGCAMEET